MISGDGTKKRALGRWTSLPSPIDNQSLKSQSSESGPLGTTGYHWVPLDSKSPYVPVALPLLPLYIYLTLRS